MQHHIYGVGAGDGGWGGWVGDEGGVGGEGEGGVGGWGWGVGVRVGGVGRFYTMIQSYLKFP